MTRFYALPGFQGMGYGGIMMKCLEKIKILERPGNSPGIFVEHALGYYSLRQGKNLQNRKLEASYHVL